MSRRILLQRGAAGATLLSVGGLLAACGSSGDSSSGSSSDGGSTTLTFVSYGGPYQAAITKAWLDPYVKENPNVKIIQDNPTDYPKLELMVTTDNVSWDLVDVGDEYGLASSAPYLEPIDCKVVDCENSIPTDTYRVPFMQFAMTMAWRKDKISQPPQSWAEYFDLDKFPGKRSFWKFIGQSGTLEAALLADGVPPDQLYPLDVDRALAKLDTIKDDIIWWTDIAQSTQLLASEEVLIGTTYNSRAYAAVQSGIPIEIGWTESLSADDYLVIPKGAPNAAEAQKLAAYITSAENNAELSKIYPLSPTNVEAEKNVDPSASTFKWLPSEHKDDLIAINDKYYDENYEEVNLQFEEWLES